MTVKFPPSAIAMVAVLGLGACAERSHGMMNSGMMGSGMMAKQTACPMMQKQANSAGGKGMANMSGCAMMGSSPKAATPSEPRPNDTEDHSAHHPES